eukprot:8827949-Alexandrium_andersonii.AAC.1
MRARKGAVARALACLAGACEPGNAPWPEPWPAWQLLASQERRRGPSPGLLGKCLRARKCA